MVRLTLPRNAVVETIVWVQRATLRPRLQRGTERRRAR